jgi:hypothetical protein
MDIRGSAIAQGRPSVFLVSRDKPQLKVHLKEISAILESFSLSFVDDRQLATRLFVMHGVLGYSSYGLMRSV